MVTIPDLLKVPSKDEVLDLLTGSFASRGSPSPRGRAGSIPRSLEGESSYLALNASRSFHFDWADPAGSQAQCIRLVLGRPEP